MFFHSGGLHASLEAFSVKVQLAPASYFEQKTPLIVIPNGVRNLSVL
jgi:hypothetical protein